MKEKINKVETYESPKCEVMELLSEGPLLRPSLGDMGDGDDGHIPEEGDYFMVRIIKCIFMKPFYYGCGPVNRGHLLHRSNRTE